MRVLFDGSRLRSAVPGAVAVAATTLLGCPSDRAAPSASGGAAGSSATGSGATSPTGGSGGGGGSAGTSVAGSSGTAGNGERIIGQGPGGETTRNDSSRRRALDGRVDEHANAPASLGREPALPLVSRASSIGVDLSDDGYSAVIDGKKAERFQAAKGRAVRTVATGLAAGSHTLELYREIEASYGSSQFFGVTGATLEAPPPSRGRLLEFVGDSISAGYGNLGNEPHPDYGNPSPCTFSFDTESGFMSYGAVTARALGADASIIAVSGWGVYRSRTSSTSDVLPQVYGHALGLPAMPAWDYRTKPQAVVINLGTNDFSPGDPDGAYTAALGTFIDTVRTRYPAAWIFCAVGTMYSGAQHAKALSYAQSVVNARGGDTGKVAAVDLGSQDALQGTGCDWHPSVAEDQRMADILVPLLKQKLAW
jgi:lysophospholipase L1-like esterase